MSLTLIKGPSFACHSQSLKSNALIVVIISAGALGIGGVRRYRIQEQG